MRLVGVAVGDTVFEGHPLVFVEPADVGDLGRRPTTTRSTSTPSAPISPRCIERHAHHARRGPSRRRRQAPPHTNQRTARENIDDLCDAGTFVEHGSSC